MNNFHDIYLDLLESHLSYDFYNKPRDQAQYERLMTNFELDNPIERVVYSQERKINLTFQFAEFLWYMSGSASLAFIGYYASNMRKYSADGLTLQGTAYGSKLCKCLSNGKTQLETVVELLKTSPDTKRAVIQIFDAEELSDTENIDVSCTLCLQFLIRNGRLNCIAFMRANDMYVGMSSDVFSFTMIQEYIARRLNIEVGTYFHVVGSSHIYEVNFEKAKNVVASGKAFETYGLSFPPMPVSDLETSLQTVLYYEKALRLNDIQLSNEAISKLSLDSYWKDVIRLFELKREQTYDTGVDMDIVDGLNETFRYLYLNKFGD